MSQKQGKSVETHKKRKEKKIIPKHGLQNLGKSAPDRRIPPPQNPPSLGKNVPARRIPPQNPPSLGKNVPARRMPLPPNPPSLGKNVPARRAPPPPNLPSSRKNVPTHCMPPPPNLSGWRKNVPVRGIPPPPNLPKSRKNVPPRGIPHPPNLPNFKKNVPARVIPPPPNLPSFRKNVPARGVHPPPNLPSFRKNAPARSIHSSPNQPSFRKNAPARSISSPKLSSSIIFFPARGMPPPPNLPSSRKKFPTRGIPPPPNLPSWRKNVPNRGIPPPLNLPSWRKNVPTRGIPSVPNLPSSKKHVLNRGMPPPPNLPSWRKNVPTRGIPSPPNLPSSKKHVPNRGMPPPNPPRFILRNRARRIPTPPNLPYWGKIVPPLRLSPTPNLSSLRGENCGSDPIDNLAPTEEQGWDSEEQGWDSEEQGWDSEDEQQYGTAQQQQQVSSQFSSLGDQDNAFGPTSPLGGTVHETAGEEELQLQLALAMSREEAEQEDIERHSYGLLQMSRTHSEDVLPQMTRTQSEDNLQMACTQSEDNLLHMARTQSEDVLPQMTRSQSEGVLPQMTRSQSEDALLQMVRAQSEDVLPQMARTQSEDVLQIVRTQSEGALQMTRTQSEDVLPQMARTQSDDVLQMARTQGEDVLQMTGLAGRTQSEDDLRKYKSDMDKQSSGTNDVPNLSLSSPSPQGAVEGALIDLWGMQEMQQTDPWSGENVTRPLEPASAVGATDPWTEPASAVGATDPWTELAAAVGVTDPWTEPQQPKITDTPFSMTQTAMQNQLHAQQAPRSTINEICTQQEKPFVQLLEPTASAGPWSPHKQQLEPTVSAGPWSPHNQHLEPTASVGPWSPHNQQREKPHHQVIRLIVTSLLWQQNHQSSLQGVTSLVASQFPAFGPPNLKSFLGNVKCLRVSDIAGEETVHLVLNFSICWDSDTAAACANPDCPNIHVCRHFLLDSCCFGNNCKKSHSLDDEHNLKVMKTHYLEKLTASEQWAVVRQACNSPQAPEICKYYNLACCRKGDGCEHLHVCRFFVTGECPFPQNCPKNHDIFTAQCRRVLANYGLSTEKNHEKATLNQLEHFVNAASKFKEIQHNVTITKKEKQYTKPKKDTALSAATQNNDIKGNQKVKQIQTNKKQDPDQMKEICPYNLLDGCKNGEKCMRIHWKLPYKWQIQEAGGYWLDLLSYQSKSLEESYVNVSNDTKGLPGMVASKSTGNKRLFNLLGEKHWVASFDEMILNSKNSHLFLRLRRLSTPSSVGCKSGGPATTQWIWYYQLEGPPPSWKRYGSEGSEDLITTLSSEFEKVFISNPKGMCIFSSGKQEYRLDLENMMQVGLNSNKQRRVRRRPFQTAEVSNDEPSLISVAAPRADRDEPLLFPVSAPRAFAATNSAVNTVRPFGVKDLPSGWLPMTKDSTFRIVEVPADSKVFKHIKQLMSNSPDILTIKHIQNVELWSEFCMKKIRMLKKYGQDETLVRDTPFLFHGTTHDMANKILNQNFDCRLSGTTTGHIWGQGVYFTSQAKHALRYCRPDDITKERYLFVARVLVGQYVVGRADLTRPPVNLTASGHSGREMLYDSTVNDLQSPTTFVKYFDHEFYPEFLITLK